MNDPSSIRALPALPLPDGITSRRILTETGLEHHVLEAGNPERPLLLLLHGFPELAFSWRHVMRPLAAAGYRVVAPDLRGYGRTTGWDADYDDDLAPFSMLSFVRDIVALVRALGRRQTFATIGHDYGSPVTAWSALLRPDVHPRAVLMSAPFGGPPPIEERDDPVHVDLLNLPRPRKHYQWYYATSTANTDMTTAKAGVHAFLRAYFHMKSADWAANAPRPLSGWSAEALAEMPTYYIMDAGEDIAETVAHHMPSPSDISDCRWMTDADMAVYAAEYGRTGFQGGLQSYRCGTSPRFRRALSAFHGRRIEVPLLFIAGQQDWGWAQFPGAREAMETTACDDFRGTHLVDGAG
ncbi:MAG: alpha/beta fold hydrolase, partial [Pseudomonadota bacterium]